MDRERIDNIEAQLAQVQGTAAVRVKTGLDGLIEVHAVAGSGQNAAGLRRQLRSALFAKFGLDVDMDQVHVVETDRRAPRSTPASVANGSRLLFRSVNVYQESHRAEAQVELVRDGALLVGSASGIAVRRSLGRLVARATLDAMSGFLGDELVLDLLAVEFRRLGGRRIALTHLVLLRAREETHLTGSVLVAQDPLEAVVLSILDALNRILPGLEHDVVEYEVTPLAAH